MNNEIERAELFFTDVTDIDHSFIDSEGYIVGGSLKAQIRVSGEIDPVEKVVVDFSGLKKTLKNLIDEDVNGFDHKLWIPEFNGELTKTKCDDVSRITMRRTILAPNDPITFSNHKFSVTGPGNAFRLYRQDGKSLIAAIQFEMEEYLTLELQERYDDETIEVQVHLVPLIMPYNNGVYQEERSFMTNNFTYVHGLKDSTSWGCQNIAHGHLSFIQPIFEGFKYDVSIQRLNETVAKALNNTIFVNRENYSSVDDNHIIQYTTPRGSFKMVIPHDVAKSNEKCKLVVLDTETTVEFLANYVKNTFGVKYKVLKVKELYISEGLSKGAVVKL